ncbi:MAG: TIGR04282 family arsenosugar biosynthesis glycosyltransferase [Alphaproteobacteria bacterium]|nr:TIGR04282 family arsenosugar biosynthesis glycosyltransferase [Alphaproteobacteria bacterium]
MVKEPRPGRVKTRLGRDIGMVAAAWWFRHQTTRLLRRLRDGRWDLILAVSPDRDGMQSRVWPADLSRIPQGQGDLGDRMARIFRNLPPGPVVIIGADIPAVSSAHISRAFAALGRNDAVIGPAPDGGYWLIGLSRVGRISASLFRNVRWSGPHALSDTVTSLGALRIARTDTLRDVDDVTDL